MAYPDPHYQTVRVYLLSILVLVEIIQATLFARGKSWKFQVFYFCLCTITLGIGGIFIDQYLGRIQALGIMGIFFLVVFAFATLLFYLFRSLPASVRTKFEGKSKWIVFIGIVISICTATIVLKWIFIWVNGMIVK